MTDTINSFKPSHLVTNKGNFIPLCARVIGLVLTLAGLTAPSSAAGELAHNPSSIPNLAAFEGPASARETLLRQGFTVTGQQFKQIFEPYPAKDTGEVRLPQFITVDSAWHTYLVLLEDALRFFEENHQTKRLLTFSRELYFEAERRRAKPARNVLRARMFAGVVVFGGRNLPTVVHRAIFDRLSKYTNVHGDEEKTYRNLALYAAVGLVMQEPEALTEINKADRRAVSDTVAGLTAGSGIVPTLFFGEPFDTSRLQPQSFYADKTSLRAYFTARRWYSQSAFQVQSPDETYLAVVLSDLIANNTTLAELYRDLTVPYDHLLGPKDDLSVEDYTGLIDDLKSTIWPRTVAESKKTLQAMVASRNPDPLINDRTVSNRRLSSFRLLAPRRLPSSVVFQNTTHPTIHGRIFPSGIDLFAVEPMVCEAGRRALSDSPFAEAIFRAPAIHLPNTHYGRSLRLIRELTDPLPSTAPQSLLTDAWTDKQLWTSLGAVAELRHTWALHTKVSNFVWSMLDVYRGYVSPYPSFFTGLSELSRDTAARLEASMDPSVDFDEASRNLQKAAVIVRREYGGGHTRHEEIQWLRDLGFFFMEYERLRGMEPLGTDPDRWSREMDWLARRWASTGNRTPRDTRLARLVLRTMGRSVAKLPLFASLCDDLARIAAKELNGDALDMHDSSVINGYGDRLAGFHHYEGNHYELRDDFPRVTELAIGRGGAGGSQTLYAGVGRPEALFVIIEVGGIPVLHRGAVLTYRETRRSTGSIQDDTGWREVLDGSNPPFPPRFTTTFRPSEGAPPE